MSITLWNSRILRTSAWSFLYCLPSSSRALPGPIPLDLEGTNDLPLPLADDLEEELELLLGTAPRL